jgi:tetratricopeptide (TPR) repeat protein
MRTALVFLILCAGIARAEELDAARLAELATVAHKDAQKTKDPKKYEEAAGYYEKYFAKPDAKEGVMAFYYGELLFNLQRYDQAAKMYERSITVEPKSKFADEAAYAYVISTKNAIHKDDAAGKPPCPDSKPCPIPADKQRLLTAFDRYLAIVTPTNKDRATMEYRRAQLFYEYNHFAEAAPIFDHVFVSYPGNELATYSANLEMDCLALLKRYGELRALVERVKKSPIMSDATTQKQVHDNEAALKKLGK